MNSKTLMLLKDAGKKLSIFALAAALIASCGKSSEGDVFDTNSGTSGQNTGNNNNNSGNTAGQFGNEWNQVKQNSCPQGTRMADIVIDNVSSYGGYGGYGGYNNNYWPNYGGQQQQSNSGSGIGYNSTGDAILVQDNGNGTSRVVLSLCTYSEPDYYTGRQIELIGPNAGISNQLASFSGSVTQSNCSVGGWSGSIALYGQNMYYYQQDYIWLQFQPINLCN